MALTPDQLTRKYWGDKGYLPVRVEKWVLYPQPRRSDFLGTFDYLCLGTNEIIAVQTTTLTNFSARKRKMLGSKALGIWFKTGQKSILQVWGKKSGRWYDKTVEFTMKDWEEYQAEEKAKYAKEDKNSPLYKELFGEE